MLVFLLATDETAKLRPLTERIPAPLVPVVDRPVIARVFELLARNGLKQARTALYRLPGNIERYCGDGRRWGVHLDYLLQREALGSAGSLKWAEAGLKETFLVLPADVLFEMDIEAAAAFHRSHGGLATTILTRTPGVGPSAFLSADGRVRGAGGRPAGGEDGLAEYRLTGAYIFEPQVLSMVPGRTRFDCACDLLPCLIGDSQQSGSAWGYVDDGYWNPLDSFTALQEAQRVYMHSAWAAKVAAVAPAADDGPQPAPPDGPRVRYPSLDGLQIAPGIWAGRNLAVHPSVRLAPPVYLGDNCQVGQDVELGPAAVLGPNVIVDDQATVSDSVVLEHTYVGRLVNVDGRVVDRTLTVDAATGASTVIVDRFLLAETTPASVSAGLGRLADVVSAAVLLVLTLPVTVLSGLLALLSSLTGGAGFRVLEKRPRMGRPPAAATGDQAAVEPQPFGMVHLITRRADGRYTPFGGFLERSELARLPALWNVLRGDMRMVGVQPLTPDELEKAVEDWQRERLSYPPGFSGLWYVQAPRNADPDSTAVADAYYVATRSGGGDIHIVLQTPGAWVRRIRAGDA